MATTARAPTSGGRATGPQRPTPAASKAVSTSSVAVRAAAVQGPPRVTLDGPAAAAPEPVGAKLAADEIDLSTGELAIPEPTAAGVKEGKDLDLKVRLPGLAEGALRVRKRGPSFTTAGAGQAILLRHPALARFSASNPTVLVLTVKENKVGGWVGLGTPGPAKGSQRSLLDAMAKGADLLQWAGLSKLTFPSIHNTFEGGVIAVSVENLGFTVGNFLSGSGSVALDNKALSFDGSAKVEIPGGSGGELRIKQDPTGALSGTLNILVQIGSVAGTVVATLSRGFVSIMGQVAYSGDRLSGKITLAATDEPTARDITLAKPAAGSDVPIELPGPDKPAKPGKRAFCGWGQLTFRVTDWLAGAATVIINSKGQATIVGEIAPPKEFILFEQKEWIKNIFKLEIRAGYGIPVVGQVGLFANIGLDAIAKIGPGKLYNIKLQGAYSTDPRVAKNLSIEGTLNISAFAGLRLRAEAGLVVTILGHDIKAGVGLNAIAGVRGYVEATPRIGMRELAPGGKREYFIQGHLEIAAQPVLGFSGDLFVAIETPWWSPLSDKRWTWPLFSIEYPLPGEFGIGADVDYVLGSKQWPKIAFGEVNFDSSKFMTDVMNDNTDKGGGGEKKKQGEWEEGLGGKGKGGAKNKGGAGKSAGDMDDDIGPIGEEETFSDGSETHRLWFEQKGTDAQLMMASKRMTVEEHFTAWQQSFDMLMPEDEKRAVRLVQQAREQLAQIDGEANQVAAMKVATRRAKEVYEKNKGKKGTKQKKGKDGAKELNKKVKADQRALREPLTQLAILMHKVPFNVPPRRVTMFGGSQTVTIVDDGGKATVRIGKDKPSDLIGRILLGPYAKVKYVDGRDALNVAGKKILPLEIEIARSKIKQGQILGHQLLRLPKFFDKVVPELSKLGTTLKVASLHRAETIGKIYPKTLTFVFYKLPEARSQNRLEREVTRQLDLQRDGLNAMTVDTWLTRVDTYSTKKFETFDELKAEEKRAVAAELAARADTARTAAEAEAKALEAERKQNLQRVRDAQKQLKAAETELEETTQARTADAARARADARARRDQAEGELLEIRAEVAAMNPALAEKLAKARRDKQEAETALVRLTSIDVKQQTATQQAITSAEVSKFHGGRKGRYENLEEFKKLHAAALDAIKDDDRFLARWKGLIDRDKQFHFAVLHNPDQVAGGKGMYDLEAIAVVSPPGPEATPEHKKAWNEYLKMLKAQIGSQYVNGRLGGFAGKGETRDGWPLKIGELRDHAKGQGRAAAAYPMWRMNVRLLPNYVVKPKE